MSTTANQPNATRVLLGAIFFILLILALRTLAGAIVPVVLGVFIAIASVPLSRRIAGIMPHGLKWLGLLAVMVLLVVFLTAFIGGLVFSGQRIAAQVPEISQSLADMLPDSSGDSQFGARLREIVRENADAIGSTVLGQVEGVAQAVASATGLMITGMILVLFLVLLALGEADRWRGKLDALTGGTDWHRVTETLGQTLRQFILVRAFIGIVTAVAYAIWLMIFGLDLILVWAILAFLLTFVPNLGSLVSGILPTLYAFLTLDFGTAFLAGAGLFLIEQVIGNWLDPKLQGRRVSLSPLVILITIIFWGVIWGVVGAFLATPITLAVMIICNAVAALRPVALMLSNQTDPEDLDASLGWADDFASRP